MDYKDVGHVFRGYFNAGRLKVQDDGFYFKALKSSKVFQVPADDIDNLEWMPAARGYEVKIVAKDGSITKFSGFKNEDYVELKNFIKSHFHKELHSIDVCVKGWNWGDLEFQDSLMSFNIDSKAAFQVPMNEVSQIVQNGIALRESSSMPATVLMVGGLRALLSDLLGGRTTFKWRVTSGKNEVVMEFHLNEDSPLSLVEMRFHVPHTNIAQLPEDVAEGETVPTGPDPVKELHDKILAKADVIQAIGDAIVTFSEIHCLTPSSRLEDFMRQFKFLGDADMSCIDITTVALRSLHRGRYSVKIYPSFLQLHGKTFDYKIPHKSVLRLFLLPHNDQRQMFFVIQLDPPLRQGQTRYHFVIFLLSITEERDIVLSLTDDEIKERYGADTKVHQEMSGAFYQLFSRVMKVLVGKKVTIPGAFKNKNNQCAINCSNRATSGYLYPLDKGFIFVHKPAMYIKFDGISSVNFARMTGGAGVSKSFDFEVEMKDGNAHHFSSLMKEDYDRLSQFVSEKKLRVKSKGKAPERIPSYNDDASSDSDHDAYLARMKAEGEDKDSEDEDSDFVAGDSGGSADELEFDSDAKVSDNDDGSGKEMSDDSKPKMKSRKRKASPTAPTKHKKAKLTEGSQKKKAKRDPDAPKKPMTSYMLWLQDNREDIKRKHPGISIIEVTKKAGVMWKALATIDKKRYEEKANKLKKEYQRTIAEYKASGGASAFTSKSESKISKTSSGSPKKKPKKVVTAERDNTKQFKSAEFVPSDEDGSSAESTKNDQSSSSSEDEGETTTDRRALRSGGDGDEKLVALPSDGEDESEASDSGEDQISSGSDS